MSVVVFRLWNRFVNGVVDWPTVMARSKNVSVPLKFLINFIIIMKQHQLFQL